MLECSFQGHDSVREASEKRVVRRFIGGVPVGVAFNTSRCEQTERRPGVSIAPASLVPYAGRLMDAKHHDKASPLKEHRSAPGRETRLAGLAAQRSADDDRVWLWHSRTSLGQRGHFALREVQSFARRLSRRNVETRNSPQAETMNRADLET